MTKQEWIKKCNYWKTKWPVMQDEYQANNHDYSLNIYAVLDAVNKHSQPEDILMGDAGSISYAGPVALNAKTGQRFIFSPAQADMGWALPAAIGVAMSSCRPVISIIGDGSFMSNLQELAVVKQHNLNIKFVILNNNGYLSIKNTQSKYFQGRIHGTSSETGLWFPIFKNVATTFGLDFYDVKLKDDLDKFDNIFRTKGPCIIDCHCLSDQEILPAQALKNGKQCGLHDMTPFLSDEELAAEMIVKIK
jgi:acetolactate synthase I/II/III large subunit